MQINWFSVFPLQTSLGKPCIVLLWFKRFNTHWHNVQLIDRFSLFIRNELRKALESAIVRTNYSGSRIWSQFWSCHQRFFKHLWSVWMINHHLPPWNNFLKWATIQILVISLNSLHHLDKLCSVLIIFSKGVAICLPDEQRDSPYPIFFYCMIAWHVTWPNKCVKNTYSKTL